LDYVQEHEDVGAADAVEGGFQEREEEMEVLRGEMSYGDY
jgi:hypothetical protein